MKKILISCLFLFCVAFVHAQTTYYWVGGTGTTSLTANSNWNTALDGSGSSRTASTSDILVFDGSNIGGASPATGTVTVTVTSAGIGQLKFINNADVVFSRPAGGGGTGTLTINGAGGNDFFVEAGSTLTINTVGADGNVAVALTATANGLVNGAVSIIGTGQNRITNQAVGSLVFTSGSTLRTGIMPAAASYPLGSSSQSVNMGVVFEAGATLYYEGGTSFMGNSSTFSAINFHPGSTLYWRGTNATSGAGSFTNQKSFGNIIVENNATMNADGPIYRIGEFTINSGSTVNTHSSGQTAVFGNLLVNGTLKALSPTSTNVLIMGGSSAQTISGGGEITVPGFVVADNSDVTLNMDVSVNNSAYIFGKLNFITSRITGTGDFTARVNYSSAGVDANVTAGSYQITGAPASISSLNGLTVTGAGIEPNTSVVGFSSSAGTIYLSKPALASGTGVSLTFESDTATLATSNTNGFDHTTGSVTVTGNISFQSGTNYVINAATSTPFGVSTSSTGDRINAGSVVLNAPVTSNISAAIHSGLTVGEKFTIRPADTIQLVAGSVLTGTFHAGNYIVTDLDAVTGETGVLQLDDVSAATLVPVGNATYYLPVTLTPASASDFAVSVFQGITLDGSALGTPLTPTQKQTVVDAVWLINRLSGTGMAGIGLQWVTALEGSTFTTFGDTEIGLITQSGGSWSLPAGTGNNTTNTATATYPDFGAFSAGAAPPSDPFVFNPLPAKVYGDPDFTAGVISQNTTEAINYTSSNPLVAIVDNNGLIQIKGTGTTDITATQASDGFYPAANVTQALTVSKTPLVITANDTTKVQGSVNPVFRISYSGFVYGETEAVLLSPAVAATTAVTTSPSGNYPITVSGATSNNYEISYVGGTLVVSPRQEQVITFASLPVKTYGNASFAAGATSTNSLIPITYSSSNPNVATVTAGMIQITGAGTTTITASQAGNDAFYPAEDKTQVLTVNKANLTIRASDTSRLQGQPNPAFALVYTGFVNGETAAALTAQPVITTLAITASLPGHYAISLSGAASNNYNINYVEGRLTVLPDTGTDQPHVSAFKSSSTTLTVRVYSVEPSLGTVKLYDVNGQLMTSRSVFLPKGLVSFTLPASNLPAGIYMITVTSEHANLKKNINLR